MNEVLDVWQWHSCMPLDDFLTDTNKDKLPSLRKKIVLKAAATPKNLARFIVAGKNNLIHRNSHSWWKFSEDGKFIEAVDNSQFLEEDDLDEIANI